MTEPDAPQTFFLSDSPKDDLSAGDAFGHLFYAKALFRILETTDSTGSYAIGLFGQWGVGKTSIINELRRILGGNADLNPSDFLHRYRVITLDAWQYSDDNFRREFLIDMARAFDMEDKVRSELVTSTQVESREPPKYDRAWFSTLAKQAIAFAIIFLPLYLIMHSLLSRTDLLAWVSQAITIVISAVTATIAGFSENIKSLFTFRTTIQHSTAAVHPDQFKSLFSHIVKHGAQLSGQKRLLIVLDNLDRVAEPVVLQVLGAVRTFLDQDRCVYLLPCDDRGLKQHIRNSRAPTAFHSPMTDSEAAEYLRKFFQTSLTIRDLLSEDLATYTRELLQKMSMFYSPILKPDGTLADDNDAVNKHNLDEVSAVFRAALARNPRRIKQLANRLAANYLLAMEKRSISPELSFNIATHLGFLAKLTVLEEEWPGFYAFLIQYPDLLDQLRTHLVTGRPETLPPLLSSVLNRSDPEDSSQVALAWNKGAQSFLLATNAVQAPHVTDFFFLKQRTSVTKISDFYSYRDAALNGDLDTVERIFSSENTDATTALEILLEELTTHKAQSDRPTVTNLLRAIVLLQRSLHRSDAGLSRRAADAIAETLSQAVFSESIRAIPLDDLLPALDASSRPMNCSQILAGLIAQLDFDNKPDDSLNLVEQLSKHKGILSPDRRAQLKMQLQEQSKEATRIPVLRRASGIFLASDTSDANEFVPQSIYEQAIAAHAPVGPDAQASLLFIRPYFHLLRDENRAAYVATAVAHLKTPEPAPTPANLFALEMLNALPANLLTQSEHASILKALSTAHSAFSPNQQKFAVTSTYLRMLPTLSVEEQARYSANLTASILDANPQQLHAIGLALLEKAPELHEAASILRELRKRAVAFPDEGSLRQPLFELSTKLSAKDQIADYILALVSNPPALTASLEEAANHLSEDEFRDLLRKPFGIIESTPDSGHEQLFSGLAKFASRFDRPLRSDTTEMILNRWINNTSINTRRGAVILWNSYKPNASPEDRDKMYGRLLELATQRIDDDTIVQEANQLQLDLLISDSQSLSSRLQSHLVKLLLRMREQGRHPQTRKLGYLKLGLVAQMTQAQGTVPPDLIEDLAHETDLDQIQNASGALLKYRGSLSSSQLDAVRQALKREDLAPHKDELVAGWGPDLAGS